MDHPGLEFCVLVTLAGWTTDVVLQQNRRSVADRAMGPFFVVVSAPSLHFLLGVRKGQEPVSVEAFGPEAAVEGLDERVVGRFAGPREVQRDTALLGPQIQITRHELAALIDAKYHWHLPLYRQAQMLATHGIAIDRSTLAFWVGYAAQELKPLWHRLRQLLLASSKLCVDETPAPVLDPGRGRTKTGYFWALSRDDRPWAGPDPPGVVYAYAPGRGAVHGLRLLEGYRGIIHCDGYQAYKTMTRETRADALSGTLAFCWAHLRRQFVKIEREAAPAPAPVAREALERIAQLYAVEKALRGRSDAERRAGRQVHARPLATALKQWFEAKLDHLAQKSDTAKALRYALRHWDGLTLYLDDGRIEMDTNAVERAMRPIKLNAKNSLFAGCDEGAENWAVLASLIETCKLNGVSAEHWLADVLAKLVNGWPAARLDELLPWASIYTMHAHDPRLAA